MNKLLFSSSSCVVVFPVVVDDIQKYILYSPDYFNYLAAILTGQNKLDPEIVMHQEGYCGIIASQFVGTEMADLSQAKTMEQFSEFGLDISNTVDITNCSMDGLYDLVIDAIDKLSFEKLELASPTIH